MALRRRHAQIVVDGASSHTIDYVAQIAQIANLLLHIGKFLVAMHDKNCRSRKISKNLSALTNMTNI